MKAKTKKMVDPKFAMNSLLLRRRFSAGKNASLVFEELAPFSSFQRDNFAACLAGGDKWAKKHGKWHRSALYVQLLAQTEKPQWVTPQTTKYRYRTVI